MGNERTDLVKGARYKLGLQQACKKGTVDVFYVGRCGYVYELIPCAGHDVQVSEADGWERVNEQLTRKYKTTTVHKPCEGHWKHKEGGHVWYDDPTPELAKTEMFADIQYHFSDGSTYKVGKDRGKLKVTNWTTVPERIKAVL